MSALNYQDTVGAAWLEASPIYTSVEITVELSGSYTIGLFDFVYSYSKTKMFTRVPIVGDSATFIEMIPPQSINGVIEEPMGAIAANAAMADDEYYMTLQLMIFNAADLTGFYDPRRQAAICFPNFGTAIIEESAVIGTKTDTSTSTTTDIVRTISGTLPSFGFTGSPPGSGRFELNEFRMNVDGVDITDDVTVWTAAKWRDFRGTYSGNTTDSNGVTTTVTAVLA